MLILDGHDSHNFISLIELAVENQISIVELPAHTSHWLLPCDRIVFGPLKAYWNSACQDMMNLCSRMVVFRQHSFCGLLKTAWKKAMTAENIRSGFRACGIFPLNPDEIPAEAYMPNSTYSVTQLLTNRELLNITADEQIPVDDEMEIIAKQEAVAADYSYAEEASVQFNLDNYLSADPTIMSVIKQAISPQNALNFILSQLTEQQMSSYIYCLDNNIPLPDSMFQLWKYLKNEVAQQVAVDEALHVLDMNGSYHLTEDDIRAQQDGILSFYFYFFCFIYSYY